MVEEFSKLCKSLENHLLTSFRALIPPVWDTIVKFAFSITHGDSNMRNQLHEVVGIGKEVIDYLIFLCTWVW